MTNTERFYYETGAMIGLMQSSFYDTQTTFDKKVKIFEQKLKEYRLDFDTCKFSFGTLVNMATLGLNKEKIEKSVDMAFDNYQTKQAKNDLKIRGAKYSKIPYFNDWFFVQECRPRYLDDSSTFWVKRLRDAFMHSKFELDYTKKQFAPNDKRLRMEINIDVSTKTKTDIKVKMYYLGLNEFVEDCFSNIFDKDFGVLNEYNYLYLPQTERIKNETDLRDFLSNVCIVKVKLKQGWKYDGDKFVNDDGEISPRIDYNYMLKPRNQNYGLPPAYTLDTQSVILGPNSLAIFMKALGEDVYKIKDQTQYIKKVISNLAMEDYAINSILHNFVHITDYIDCDLKGKELNRLKKGIHDFISEADEFHKTNVDFAFAVLRMYRLIYILQSEIGNNIDINGLDLEKMFACDDEEDMINLGVEMQNRYHGLDAKQGLNRAYLETFRNALAHGYVRFKTYLGENGELARQLELEDRFIRRTDGKEIVRTLYTNLDMINYLSNKIDEQVFDMIDKQHSMEQ